MVRTELNRDCDFLLKDPIRSLGELPSELKHAPIDRPELLEFLGDFVFVDGLVSNYSYIKPADKLKIAQRLNVQGFKGFLLKKDVQIIIPDNNITFDNRKTIKTDHLWESCLEGDKIEMLTRCRGVSRLVLYQRSNGHLAVGASRLQCEIVRSRTLDSEEELDLWSDYGFFYAMDQLVIELSMSSKSIQEKAQIINDECDRALVMADDGRMFLWRETSRSFKEGLENSWRADWHVKAGVTDVLNRQGRRRNKPRSSFVDGQRRLSTKSTGAQQIGKKNSGGFG